jgi:ABC-type lipoprotein release transport system permease subunit
MQQFRFNRERIKNKSDNKKTEEWSLDLEPGEILMGRDLAAVLGVLEGDTLTALAPEGLLLPAGETPRFEKQLNHQIVLNIEKAFRSTFGVRLIYVNFYMEFSLRKYQFHLYQAQVSLKYALIELIYQPQMGLK